MPKTLDVKRKTLYSLRIQGFLRWCERRDLNPYGITTRPSNVRVCRFRHSRRVRCVFATVIIIAKVSCGVKNFSEKTATFLRFFESRQTKSHSVDF